MRSKYIQYYAEGEDDEKVIKALKDMGLIKSGKVQVINVITQRLTDARLRTLKSGTMVVLVFDTDRKENEILNYNLNALEKCSAISEIVTIPQIPNLEGELVKSCNIRTITELLNSTSVQHFKRDVQRVSNLSTKLKEHGFNFSLFWNGIPAGPYANIANDAQKVKLS